MNTNERLIPYKRIRIFLKNELNGYQVSKDVIEYLEMLCENQLNYICGLAREKIEEINHYRSLQGLPELRRIAVNLFLNLWQDQYKPPTHNMGLGKGAKSVNTSLSEASIEVT